MGSKIFWAFVVVAALITCAAAQDIRYQKAKPAISNYVRLNNHIFQPRVGVSSPPPPSYCSPCLFYGGDLDLSAGGQNGLASETDLIIPGSPYGAAVYSPFTVPKKGVKGKADWSVVGLFANSLTFNGVLDPPTCFWTINSGVSAGSGGTVVATGTDSCASTPTGRSDFGLTEFTINIAAVTGGPTLEEPSTYWEAVVPQCTNASDFNCFTRFFESDAETGLNAFGPPEPVDDSFFDSAFFGASFQPTTTTCGAGNGCDAFSAGVDGTHIK